MTNGVQRTNGAISRSLDATPTVRNIRLTACQRWGTVNSLWLTVDCPYDYYCSMDQMQCYPNGTLLTLSTSSLLKTPLHSLSSHTNATVQISFRSKSIDNEVFLLGFLRHNLDLVEYARFTTNTRAAVVTHSRYLLSGTDRTDTAKQIWPLRLQLPITYLTIPPVSLNDWCSCSWAQVEGHYCFRELWRRLPMSAILMV